MSGSKKTAQGTLGLELFETVTHETKVDNAFSELSGKAVKTLYMPEPAQAMGEQSSGDGADGANGVDGAANQANQASPVTPDSAASPANPASPETSGAAAGASHASASGADAGAPSPAPAKPEDSYDPFEPLAARMRPRNIDEYIGQSHLLGPDKPLRKALERHRCQSMILWGPPGVGKTTLALMLAKATGAVLEQLSAVVAGMADIREAVARAKERRRHGVRTILFVDEVHRFNKLQQDAFLPHVEDGTIIFVGATTENPSFQVNSALLSRARVFVLKKLTDAELEQLLDMTLNSERGLKKERLFMEDRVRQALISLADGDARHLLTTLEMLADDAADLKDGRRQITYAMVGAIAGRRLLSYDKNGDAYYDLISAFHKSVRGSAPDAALYWYARILEAGGDPSYVARRILAIATEDVGLADPNAMQIALNAWDIFNRVGSAEGERAIAEAAVYMALAPKSNHLYAAFNQVRKDVVTLPGYDVPLYIRNAPTKLMSELGYHDGYRYAHDFPGAYAPGECFMPEELHGRRYYFPSERGFEQYLKRKQKYLQQRDRMADPSELRYKQSHADEMQSKLKFRYPELFASELDTTADLEPQGLGQQVSPQDLRDAPYSSDQQINLMPQAQYNSAMPMQGQQGSQGQQGPQSQQGYAPQGGPFGQPQQGQFRQNNLGGQSTGPYANGNGSNFPPVQSQGQMPAFHGDGNFYGGGQGGPQQGQPEPTQMPYMPQPQQPQQQLAQQGYGAAFNQGPYQGAWGNAEPTGFGGQGGAGYPQENYGGQQGFGQGQPQPVSQAQYQPQFGGQYQAPTQQQGFGDGSMMQGGPAFNQGPWGGQNQGAMEQGGVGSAGGTGGGGGGNGGYDDGTGGNGALGAGAGMGPRGHGSQGYGSASDGSPSPSDSEGGQG